MTPTHARRGAKCYRYSLCCGAHRHGRQSCPSKSIPAEPIERLVLEQIRRLGSDLTPGSLEERAPALPPAEQLRLVQLLIEPVDSDGGQGKGAITFPSYARPSLTTERAAPNQHTEDHTGHVQH